MKPLHLMLVGVTLMFISFVTQKAAPNLALSFGIVLTLSYVAGALTLIIGAIRWSHEKKHKA